MAKFGATMQLLAVNRWRSSSSSASPRPVVPTTACTSCIAHQRRLPIAASAAVKSTATCAPASAIARGAARDRDPCRGRLAFVGWIDCRDELERRVAGDRLAHRGAHAPAGPEHPHTDRHARHATHRRYGHRDVSGHLRRDRARPSCRDHGPLRRGRHLRRAERPVDPARAPPSRRGTATRRPRRVVHGEPAALPRSRVGRVAHRALHHGGQQLPHRPRGRVHRERLRGERRSSPLQPSPTSSRGSPASTRIPDVARPSDGRRHDPGVRQLRGCARRDLRRSARRRDDGRGDALLVGHDGSAEGREATAPRRRRRATQTPPCWAARSSTAGARTRSTSPPRRCTTRRRSPSRSTCSASAAPW